MSEKKARRRMKSERARLATTIDAELMQKLREFAEGQEVSMSIVLEAMIKDFLSKPGKKAF